MILASPLSSPPYYAPYDISHDDFLISRPCSFHIVPYYNCSSSVFPPSNINKYILSTAMISTSNKGNPYTSF